tara:strand:+ start:331 stop:1299 length:969 start_codon:yes stop_codon:yes gene_type:complete
MKIVFIGKFNELYHEEGKARGLQKLGHDVYRFDELFMDPNDIEKIINIDPDVVIYTKLRFKDSMLFSNKMKEHKILMVSWFPDYCFDWNEGMLKYDKEICAISNSDLLIIPDGLNKSKWNKLGINQHCVRQEINDDMCFIGNKIENLNKDILFIGTLNNGVYKHRIPLIEFLSREYGNKFLHLGGSNSDEIRNSDLNDIIASVKIIIGDSLYAPSYWSNRIYETIGRGGFILHSFTEDLDKEYEIGKHFDVYKTTKNKVGWGREIDYFDLKNKIDFYLKNDRIRKSIAEEGMKYTLKNYTMTHRCKEVVNIIKSEISNRNLV